MKTLIFVLLTVICQAQSDFTPNPGYHLQLIPDTSLIVGYLPIDENALSLKINGVNAVLYDDLFDYENECFNDSTALYYYTVCDWGCVNIPCDPNAKKELIEIYHEDGTITLEELMPCIKHWHHKEPTFIGFINWLKSKLK